LAAAISRIRLAVNISISWQGAESGDADDIQTLGQSGSEPKTGEVLLEACRIAPITLVDSLHANDPEAGWVRRQDRPREVYRGQLCVDFL
jgi:hypothetical protein